MSSVNGYFPAPSPPRISSGVPTPVIQAAASSSADDFYLLELGFQRKQKKLKRIKVGDPIPGTGAKRKSREGNYFFFYYYLLVSSIFYS